MRSISTKLCNLSIFFVQLQFTFGYFGARSPDHKVLIKLCSRKAHICALPLFGICDLDINPLTLILEGGLDIQQMCLHTNNEAASSRDELEFRKI